MPVGGYYIEVDGVDELKAGLKGSRGGLRDLRRAYGHVAETAGHDVRRRVPIGSTSSKDGGAHKALPRLVSTVEWGATINGPWVSAAREDVYLHEFGGTSFWYRGGGPGLLRGANRRHANVLEAAGRAGIKGHAVYTKPRNQLGNFIWNVAYRLRHRIGEELHFGIGQVCQMHGLPYQIAADPTLDLSPNPRKG